MDIDGLTWSPPSAYWSNWCIMPGSAEHTAYSKPSTGRQPASFLTCSAISAPVVANGEQMSNKWLQQSCYMVAPDPRNMIRNRYTVNDAVWHRTVWWNCKFTSLMPPTTKCTPWTMLGPTRLENVDSTGFGPTGIIVCQISVAGRSSISWRRRCSAATAAAWQLRSLATLSIWLTCNYTVEELHGLVYYTKQLWNNFQHLHKHGLAMECNWQCAQTNLTCTILHQSGDVQPPNKNDK